MKGNLVRMRTGTLLNLFMQSTHLFEPLLCARHRTRRKRNNRNSNIRGPCQAAWSRVRETDVGQNKHN